MAAAGWRGFPLTDINAGEWVAWILGELCGRNPNQTAVELLSGKSSGKCLNGHALLIAWNRNERQWHVWSDRFGTLHAYYAMSGNSAAFGTSFEAVSQAASRKQLDWEGLTGFFGFGFFPGDRTYYKDVRILRPATHYVFSAKGEAVSAKRYWDWRHQPDYTRSYEDTVQQFGDLFLQVMEEMLGGTGEKQKAESRKQESGGFRQGTRIAIPVSGGLDSRSTVAAIGSPLGANGFHLSALNSQPFWSYSYGYSDDSIETRISREVAGARGLPFESFAIKPYLFKSLDSVLTAVEGFQDITQCRQAFVADELRQNAHYVIAAHWGDVWLDDMGLLGKAENRKRKCGVSSQLEDSGLIPHPSVVDHTLGKMAKRGRQWLLENLCAPRLAEHRPEELLREFVAEGMKPLEGIHDEDFRVKAFKTDNWSFRWTLSSIRMFQAAAFPRLPFYDTRLADFFCTVPSEYVARRRLQIDFLKRFAPDLARIEWQESGTDLFSRGRSAMWSLPRRAVRKISRVLSGKTVVERNWEVQFGGKEGRANLEHWLTRPGLKLHALVPPQKVNSLVEDFYRRWPDPGLGYAASMLLTFSTWLEHQ